MVSLILGVVLIGFCVFSVLPSMPLNWGEEVVNFLKGTASCGAAFFGIIAIFIGLADIKDKREAKEEEKKANEK